MGANSKIEWTDHTFNPWRGCAHVHTGCVNCYAERMSVRNPAVLGVWGAAGTRVVAAELCRRGVPMKSMKVHPCKYCEPKLMASDYARLASLASELKEHDERLKRIKEEAEKIQRKYRQVMG